MYDVRKVNRRRFVSMVGVRGECSMSSSELQFMIVARCSMVVEDLMKWCWTNRMRVSWEVVGFVAKHQNVELADESASCSSHLQTPTSLLLQLSSSTISTKHIVDTHQILTQEHITAFDLTLNTLLNLLHLFQAVNSNSRESASQDYFPLLSNMLFWAAHCIIS